MAIPKAGPAPLDDLAAFLTPFAALLRRSESRHALERYTTGLLCDVGRKTAAELGRALPTTNGQQLQEFLTSTAWDPGAMDRLRIEAMVARAAGVPLGTVVTDAGYGDQPALLNGLERRALPYVVGLKQNVHFRATDTVAADVAESPAAYQGRGRPRKARTLADRIKSQPATALLSALPEHAWETVAWREGTRGSLIKQFVRHRVHRAGFRGRHHDSAGWLIGERPLPGHRGDVKYYFAWGLEDLPLAALLARVHVRWVIERFYQDAKGELGLDDYEGRFWPGLHRHIALVMLAHSYLTLRQSYGSEVLSPGDTPPSKAATLPATARGFPPSGPAERRRAAAHHTRRAV